MIRSYSSLLFWLAMMITSSLMLYHTSDKVHALDLNLRKINTEIRAEQKSIHVLKAEWAYLTTPARIEATAKRHLRMKHTEPARIASLQDLGQLLPTQASMIGVAIASNDLKPNIRSTKTPLPKTARATPAAHPKRERALAKVNAGRINDRMKMESTTPVKASTDTIGALISSLGLHQ